LERERSTRKEAERRAEAATLKERAAHAEELRGLVARLQAGEGRAEGTTQGGVQVKEQKPAE